jgi:hypothetical protein
MLFSWDISLALIHEIERSKFINDEMVAGQVIDMSTLQSLIEPADLIIARNEGPVTYAPNETY